jgi:hypothetical protein
METKKILARDGNKIECPSCKQLFNPGKSLLKRDEWKKEYCSYDCYKQGQDDHILKTCKKCGKPFYIHEKYINAKNVYCSKLCRETELRKQTCKKCGKQFNYKNFVPLCPDCYDYKFVTKCHNCGKNIKKNRKYVVNSKNYNILSEKIRFGKKRLAHRFIESEMIYCSTKCAIEKERPYYYKGIGDEVYPLEFNDKLKDRIKKRDKDQCQLCGAKWGLVVHHIDYNKENSSPLNLITLCLSCHAKTNFKRKWWVNIFSKYVLGWFGESLARG